MAKKRIRGVVTIDGVGVPVDDDGQYLDWTKIRGGHAEELCSPYGFGHFVLGRGDASIVLDFAMLPNGLYVIKATPNTDVGLHVEDFYNIHSRDELPETCYHLIGHATESLSRVGVDNEVLDHDRWYFMRATLHHAGFPRYAEMTTKELRWGRRGRFVATA